MNDEFDRLYYSTFLVLCSIFNCSLFDIQKEGRRRNDGPFFNPYPMKTIL